MDTQLLSQDRVRRTFRFRNLTVDVVENPEYGREDDHLCSIRITVVGDGDDPDNMFTICPCCSRTFARILEKAADAAESIEEGTEV